MFRRANTSCQNPGEFPLTCEIGSEESQRNRYIDLFKRSVEDPENFWAAIGKCVTWTKPWERVLDNSQEPFTKWFVGGELNACYNAVDRHVESGKGCKVALIYDSPLTKTVRRITYNELLHKVARLAGALASMQVRKGDVVVIYMPLIPETIIAMLATVRLGAVHNVVFGGFSAKELQLRVDHSKPKVVIAASCGLEPNKVVKYKDILNEALLKSKHQPKKCIIYQRRNVESSWLDTDIDCDWDDVIHKAEPHPCVPVESNEPLYILYTSGTTGKPKAIQRPTGGHIATIAFTMNAIYGMTENDVWWTISDLGWVVGHSYICYAPLITGVTSVIYEGKPVNTPDAGQYFRVINDYKVNAIFSVPTALRAINKEDPNVTLGRKYSVESLRRIFVAGELCDYETKSWAESSFRVPVFNHWWQTETGHPITATCIGLKHKIPPPKLTSGLPFLGFDVRILREDGSVASAHELGRLVIKLPLPPGTLSTLYGAPETYIEIYFSKYPGYYDTMDAGYKDELGYVYVLSREDDVINVAGHRLSTAAIENVVLAHIAVSDTVVVGVPDSLKGEVPLCLFVPKKDSKANELDISRQLITMTREIIGPIAALKYAFAVSGLPRTKSGKLCKKSISDLAQSKEIFIPETVEDPSVYESIKLALQRNGLLQT